MENNFENIVALASLLPEEPKRKPGRPPKNLKKIDIPAWVEAHLPGISIRREKSWRDATIYELSECPFDGSHKAPDSCIIQQASGAVSFKCLHNSCQNHDWRELRERFDPDGDYAEPKERGKSREEIKQEIEQLSFVTGLPTIELTDSQLRDAENELMRAIMAAGKDEPLLYVRGDKLVRIVRDSDGNPKIDTITSQSMPGIMTLAANFVRTTAGNCVGVFPPGDLAVSLVNRGCWPFPALNGIVEIPVLRADGTILDKVGYDPQARLYYLPKGEVPKMLRNPIKIEGVRAAQFILDLLSDFPFQDECSLHNAIGLLLTVVVKELVGLAPMALIDAPSQGTGKGKLAQLVSIVATGRELPVSTEVKDDDEWRKQITSTLLADRPVVIIDNVERMLYSAQLAAVLTSLEWSDRLLGKSETLRLPNRSIWIATGNNIRLGGDIPRRSYWIRLNANMARPWMRDPREFKRELPLWAIEHREEIVAALLTMARAWVLGGRPDWSGRPLGSYERWSRIVGGILEYCGVSKFLTNLEDLYENVGDEEPAQWRAFLGIISEVFGNSPFMTKDLTMEMSSSFSRIRELIPENLGSHTDRNFSYRLGRALKRRKDQIFETDRGLIRLCEKTRDSHFKAPRWALEEINSAGFAGDCGVSVPPTCEKKINNEEINYQNNQDGKIINLSSIQSAGIIPASTANPANQSEAYRNEWAEYDKLPRR